MITSLNTETSNTELFCIAGSSTAFQYKNNESLESSVNESAERRIGTLEAELDARSRLLNESAMITITDLAGTIIYANNLFCEISGYERFRIIGYTHAIIRHTEVADETLAGIWRTIREGKTWRGEVKNRKKNGEILWSDATITPVLDENNKPVRYIWVQHDITIQKEASYKLTAARQQTDQQVRDNLSYAWDIQKALLPTASELNEIFNSSFVVFQPKHTVSGDFYWYKRIEDETVLVLGDGTGHGVSAAFISLMALTGLKYAVEELRMTEPGMVLSQLNSFLFRAMNKHTGSGLTESVDMSFCRYNHKTRMFRFACGRSKLYLLRKNVISVLCKGDCPARSVSTDMAEMNSQSIRLQSGDRIFMLSDGLADQFGGEKDKRLGSKRVKELLEATGNLSIEEQREEIMRQHFEWRGNGEQTDDISMIAFGID